MIDVFVVFTFDFENIYKKSYNFILKEDDNHSTVFWLPLYDIPERRKTGGFRHWLSSIHESTELTIVQLIILLNSEKTWWQLLSYSTVRNHGGNYYPTQQWENMVAIIILLNSEKTWWQLLSYSIVRKRGGNYCPTQQWENMVAIIVLIKSEKTWWQLLSYSTAVFMFTGL